MKIGHLVRPPKEWGVFRTTLLTLWMKEPYLAVSELDIKLQNKPVSLVYIKAFT